MRRAWEIKVLVVRIDRNVVPAACTSDVDNFGDLIRAIGT
jgi:hypothetical protein